MLDGSPYQGYLYAYPHKTAYRALPDRPSLSRVWEDEDRRVLFLYVHIPFCEMRCGFCNLFTRVRPPAEQVSAYLRQLRRQARAVAGGLGDASFARAAIGGGTPTYLTAAELEDLFAIVAEIGGDPSRLGASVETSPATATPDRLAVLAGHGVRRISMGVQSFLDGEAHTAGRPQRRAEVDAALDAIVASGIPDVNLDLIYGIPGQTPRTWEYSLRTALERDPAEIYLYPLYVRPLTGLGRRAGDEQPDGRDRDWDEQRMRLYRLGRDLLTSAGYVQVSMRHFRRVTPATGAVDAGPVPRGEYCCQEDGMVGLGCGARSYTRSLHYSFDYAVGVGEVRAIIDDYVTRDAADFGYAEIGFRLDGAEQRRRWLVQSLLRADGADAAAYRARFGTDLADDVPGMGELGERGWLEVTPGTDAGPGRFTLTPEGLAHSDSVGPWLVSGPVRQAMAGYRAR